MSLYSSRTSSVLWLRSVPLIIYKISKFKNGGAALGLEFSSSSPKAFRSKGYLNVNKSTEYLNSRALDAREVFLM